MKQDYYKILELEADASEKEIKNNFRLLARKYHPDINTKDVDAEKKFQKISEAYEILSDAIKRKHYDETNNVIDDDLRFEDDEEFTQNENEHREHDVSLSTTISLYDVLKGKSIILTL